MRKLTVSLIALCGLVALSGCNVLRDLTKEENDRISPLETNITKARQLGAEKCAPVELAQAEVAVEYFKHEARESWEPTDKVDMYFQKAATADKALMAKVESNCMQKPMAPAPAPMAAPTPAPAPKMEAAPPPPPPPAPKDTDGDGVYDDSDKCPDTPKGVKVDSVGCPLDTDGDGVYDYQDKCPGTPKLVKVDSVGCPLDTDGDGVYDYQDKCPTTPRGVPVDTEGCNIKKIPFNLNIEFDTGKSTIRPTAENKERLAAAAEFMKKYPGVSATVEGHTDNVGGADYNKKLSLARASEVRKHLIETYGIEASRLGAAGYGFERPIADNKTPEGRQKNRRIEATLETTIKQ